MATTFEYNAKCRLCVEIDSFENSLFAKKYPGLLRKNAFFDTARFQAMIPVGPFCEGHLLIATRQHELSFAHLGQSIILELEQLIGKVREIVENHWFGRAIVFEHGPMSREMLGGCCLEHAHMNIMPVPDTISILDIATRFVPFAPVQLSDLEQFAKRGEPYLFFMCPQDGAFAAVAPVGAGQFFRKLLAAAQPGMPWDWRTTPNADAVNVMSKVLLRC